MILSRRSKPRDTITAVVLESARPLDQEEVFQRARARVATVGRSTVYRVLRGLHEGELVRHVVGPEGKVYYESAAVPAHHHSFCRVCRRAFCVHAQLDVSPMVPPDFTLEGEVLYLFGRCEDCQ